VQPNGTTGRPGPHGGIDPEAHSWFARAERNDPTRGAPYFIRRATAGKPAAELRFAKPDAAALAGARDPGSVMCISVLVPLGWVCLMRRYPLGGLRNERGQKGARNYARSAGG